MTERKALKKFASPKVSKRYEAALRKWEKIMQPQIDALRASERLTAEDFAITINARAEDMGNPK